MEAHIFLNKNNLLSLLILSKVELEKEAEVCPNIIFNLHIWQDYEGKSLQEKIFQS